MRDGDPTTVDNMEIAPGIRVSKWKSLQLSNNADCEADWQEAISIVEQRLTCRYFEPCELLIKAEDGLAKDRRPLRFGFAIMAINCLLVETLQSFIMGKESTKDQSRELSVKFLTSASSFVEVFNKTLAQKYYTDVRCGILHIGETHNLSLIRAKGPLVSQHDGGIVINRTAFFKALRCEFDGYLAKVRSKEQSQSRNHFRKKMKAKMDFICRIKAK